MQKNNNDSLSIVSVFEAEAARRPDAIAVKHADILLTYAQLNARANYVASSLQNCGVVQGDVVALIMGRCLEQIIAMLAILKCRAAYLPLDASNPVVRNINCLEAARVRVLFTDHDCDERFAVNRQVIDCRASKIFSGESESNLEQYVDTETPCYVMFTSGSTGKPKGVIIPHRAVVRLVKNTDYISISESDSILQFAPLSFDASTFEIWGALLNGATLILYSGATFDPNIFAREIRENQVTVMWLTAALFNLIATRFLSALKGIKVLLAGGDVLYSKVINKVLDEMPELVLINGYGPTENTTFTCCHRITVANRPKESVPIGKPISGTHVHILDEYLRTVPDGEIGELYTSGLGVALGYLLENDSKNTSFFRDESIADGLIYRTGDLVLRNADGEIEFKGRRDHQVKIRGYRVALEEVQASILKLEHVVDVVVMVEKFDNGDQQLAAYLLLNEEEATTIAEVRQALSAELPSYMVPDLIRLSTHLPVNKNGKIDRSCIKESIS